MAVDEVGPGVPITMVVQVDAADAPQIGQESQGAIHRHQTDPGGQPRRLMLDLLRLERTTGPGEDLQDRLSRLCQAKTRLSKGGLTLHGSTY
jgi:hypothetical protein